MLLGFQIGLNEDGVAVLNSLKHKLPELTALLQTNKYLKSFVLTNNKLNPMMKISTSSMALVNR